MAGWVCIFGKDLHFDHRIKNFQARFFIAEVGEPKIEIRAPFPDFKIISWAWVNEKIPDFYIHVQAQNLLFLHGVITELDDFFPALTFEQKTERLLSLWNEYEDNAIAKLNGSFSCAFYNDISKRTTIYVDRFASRSVWLGKENEIWIAGNYPSGIVSFMDRGPRLDPGGLWSFFHAGRPVGNHSLYSNVRALMAGQKAILLQGSEAKISYWWRRKYEPENKISPCEWGARLAHVIKKSASRYKNVSKKPYLFLSGGLDSRIVAAAFREPLKTLTIITNPNAESRIASSVSQILGLEHKTIIRSPYWYLENTKASSLISSGIYLNHHVHFLSPVKLVLSEVKDAAFLLGDLMENFNKHYFSLPPHYPLIFLPEKIIHILYSFVPYTIKNYKERKGKLFNKKKRNLLERHYLSALREYAQSVMEVSENHEDRLDAFLRWSNVGITPTYNMITCLWPFARERNIYFDNDVDDLSLKIPSYLRRKGILHKWILFHLSKMLLVVPDANTFLPPAMPKVFADCTKKIRPYLGKLMRHHMQSQNNPMLRTSGSWLLLHEMYRKDKTYRDQIESFIYNKDIFPPDLFDLDEIERIWQVYLKGDIRYHFEIEALRSFGSLSELIKPCGIDS